MDRESLSVLRQFFCLWVALLAAPALAATDVEAYGRLPSIEQAALSPDGTKIAFVKTTQDFKASFVARRTRAQVVHRSNSDWCPPMQQSPRIAWKSPPTSLPARSAPRGARLNAYLRAVELIPAMLDESIVCQNV
jgi:hypothetical protein